MPSSIPHSNGRRGFILPFVLLALLLISGLSVGTTLIASRAARSSRLGMNSERALLGADAAIVKVLASWSAADRTTLAVGDTRTEWITTDDGGAVEASVSRTGALDFLVGAAMRSRIYGTRDSAHRELVRPVRLIPPPLTLAAAATIMGAIETAADTSATSAPSGIRSFDGRDTPASGERCSPLRDTASIAGLYHFGSLPAGMQVVGAPPSIAVRATDATATLRRARLAAAIADAMRRATALVTPVVTRSLHAIVTTPVNVLPTVYIAATDAERRITMTGESHLTGTLLVDGNLTLAGALTVDGLLIVHGALDTADGSLDVHGGLLVVDPDTTHAAALTLGSHVAVRYSPCTVAHALAPLSRPSTSAYAVWAERWR